MMEAFMPLLRDGLDPVPALEEQRRAGVRKLEFPFGISAWLVSRHDEVRAVLADHDSFSNAFTSLSAVAGEAPPITDPGGLGFADPPGHTRLRRILTPEFTMRRLQRLAPRIDVIVAEQLATMRAHGTADIVADFAMPIPSLVICELLGVPYADRHDFQQLSESRFDLFANLEDPTGAMSESLHYLTGLVERERRDPGEALLGQLVRDHGDDLTDTEIAGLADGLLTGGHETTASMLALGTLVLLDRPDLAASIRDDDTAVAPIVEDLLRYLTVVQVAFPRFARHDLEIGGQRIATGEMVLCSLSGADRDPALGPTPGVVDPAHASTAHLAFGHGIHRCVGAELARMELRAAFPALLRTFPGLRLDIDRADIAFREYSIVHGVDQLPVTW